jgi:hypothetical protein
MTAAEYTSERARSGPIELGVAQAARACLRGVVEARASGHTHPRTVDELHGTRLARRAGMPNDPELAPIVDPHGPRLSRVRKRLAIATGFGAGAATTVGLALALLHAPPPPAPAAPPTIAISMPPPLVVTIEKTIEAPRPAVPGDELGCVAPTTPDLPIGRAVDPADVSDVADKPARVIAAPSAPQLAVLHEGTVWVSDDEGRSFSRAFEGHAIDHIAIDRDGVIYAQAAGEVGPSHTWGTCSDVSDRETVA